MKKVSKAALVVLILLLVVSPVASASTVFTQAERLISDVQKTIIAMSTAALAVGAGFGAFMMKFSGGDHQKIANGKKLIWVSVSGWAVINGITLIVRTVQPYIQ